MSKLSIVSRSLLLLTSLQMATSACVSREEMERLQTAQQDMQARLETLERARQAPPTPPQGPRGPDASKTYAIPVGHSAIDGQANALVTIVEISDFQCPFCSRAAATLQEIKNKYKADVRVVFKNNPLPFHPRAMPAALAAECAGQQGKFFVVADAMFAEQTKLSDEDLLAHAKTAGLNEAKFKACLTAAEPKAAIAEDMAVAAKFGARGTPAFFINGRFLSGAQPLQNFAALIDEELAKAKKSGVAPAAYYAQEIEGKGEKAP